ncbi:O-antigen ligase family protein [Tritonibacter scottomollicae]|uniref:O-antigen ligase family protein n=1 Tax=Tritonibacter scottomollicae TaxID=483013 RepID=UPI003AA7C2CA
MPVAMVVIPWDFGAVITIYRAFMRGLSLPIMILEMLVAILAIQQIAHPAQKLRNLTLKYKLGIVSLVLIALYTSIFVAIEPYLSIISLYMWIIHILFGFGVFLIFMEVNAIDRRMVWKTILLGLFTYIVILIFVVVQNLDNVNFDWIGGLPGMPNVRQLGYLSVVGFAASTAFIDQPHRSSVYILGFFTASISLALAIWSGTRGSLIAVFAALSLSALFKKELRTSHFGGWLMASLIVGIAIAWALAIPHEAFGFGRIIGSIHENYDTVNKLSSGRGEMWAGTINKILERPIFGYGERQFQFIVPEAQGGFKQPHNFILQYLLQWGFVGAGIFFYLIFQSILHLYRKTNRFFDIGQPELLIISSILFYSLYDGALFAPYSIAMLIFAFAFALAAPTQPAPAPAADR